jgi:hypothetical protein
MSIFFAGSGPANKACRTIFYHFWMLQNFPRSFGVKLTCNKRSRSTAPGRAVIPGTAAWTGHAAPRCKPISQVHHTELDFAEIILGFDLRPQVDDAGVPTWTQFRIIQSRPDQGL